MSTLIVNVRGERRHLDAVEGWTVMEILRAHALPIPATCGGFMECGTCHVVVEPEWLGRLHPAREDEAAMLAGVVGVHPGSRLACQLVFGPELDGLEVTLPVPE